MGSIHYRTVKIWHVLLKIITVVAMMDLVQWPVLAIFTMVLY